LAVRLPFVEVPAEELEKSVRTNLIGAANVARAFLPALSNAGTGILAVMASNPEGYPLANLSVYALCKTAVERLWQAISAEVEDTELAVVAVYPGLVQTDMLTASLGEQAKDYPLPSDWARIAAPFLLGLDPEANGQHLTIPTE
jgi:NAD(P)-dependent dehydrogenase (short-subunit alcohol dehydrogenase family)